MPQDDGLQLWGELDCIFTFANMMLKHLCKQRFLKLPQANSTEGK